MKVRVKQGQKGFIYGLLRREDQEFTLKPVEHSVEEDENGDPLVISVESQFSTVWMEKLEPESDEPKEPSDMKVNELKDALNDADVDIPDGAKKADLVELLEDQLTS